MNLCYCKTVKDISRQNQLDKISKYLFEHIEESFRGRVARTANKKIADLYSKTENCAKKYEAIKEYENTS